VPIAGHVRVRPTHRLALRRYRRLCAGPCTHDNLQFQHVRLSACEAVGAHRQSRRLLMAATGRLRRGQRLARLGREKPEMRTILIRSLSINLCAVRLVLMRQSTAVLSH
jgi:hypothetical protein